MYRTEVLWLIIVCLGSWSVYTDFVTGIAFGHLLKENFKFYNQIAMKSAEIKLIHSHISFLLVLYGNISGRNLTEY